MSFKSKCSLRTAMAVMLLVLGHLYVCAQRLQQPLDRGVVAVYRSGGRSVTASGGTGYLVSWRKLAQEPEGTTYNVYKRSAGTSEFTKMNAIISPEIQKINKRYAGKKDQASMMKRNEETMAVYNKYGVKPTGGCLQLIIQFPILLALYRVVWNIPAYVGRMRDIYYNIISVLSDKFSGFMENEAFSKLLANQGTAISADKITKITETFADASASTEAMTTALPLLYQSGYITIKDYDRETESYILSIPNKEVLVGLIDGLIPAYIGLDGCMVQDGFALN